MALNKEKLEFKDSEKLTKWLIWFLYLRIAGSVIAVISGFFVFQFFNDLKNSVYSSHALAVAAGAASDHRQHLIALLRLFIAITFGFLALKWIYRANYNCRQLGAKDMTHTPGSAIGYFFIPVVNLWEPYLVMKEIWKASVNPKSWKSVDVPAIFGWWWFLQITSGAINMKLAMSLIERHIAKGALIDNYIDSNTLRIIADASVIPVCFVLILIVRKIYEAQVNSRPADAPK